MSHEYNTCYIANGSVVRIVLSVCLQTPLSAGTTNYDDVLDLYTDLCVALLLSLVVATFAAPQGYNVGTPSGAGLTSGPGSTDGGAGAAGGDLVNGGGAATGCQEGEVLHVDGTCVTPEVTRKVYVFNVPEHERPIGPAPSIPPPAVDHNILFVRLPEEAPAPDPIVLPPPRQNNIVYVLNKQEEQAQRVIEVPAQPQADPEIYFVNYQDGENPTLPLGVDLETALGAAAAAGGQVLGGVDGAGGEAGVGGAAGFGGVGGLGGAGGITGVHGGNGLGGVNGLGVVNGVGVSGGVNGEAGGFQNGSGGSPAGLYTTP
ncbi:pupal cuticle protein 36-like [Penaeus monodon]|uniref:pupal cuticle protein 36-like n=1 Tax=Penaeus monodon TaxID=6687 RepID=UPI0018A6DD86|nr:pupal cuticle protein 36-like [Penaeus monodon]